MHKIQEIDQTATLMEQDIGLINQQLLTKATINSIEAIQREMEDFIRTEQFERVMLKMENYTTTDTFNEHRKHVEDEMAEFNVRFDAIPSLGDLE